MVDFAFLDSGTGGIPYLVNLMKKCPEANCVYVGDTANFPYGEKSHEKVVDCTISLCKKIIQKFAPKVIVVACNTITVNSLDILREAFPDIPFVGTVPAIKVAGEISRKRCIGLLATNSTVKNPYNQELKRHFASDCKMVLRGDPDLISFIEHKSFTATKQEREEACKPAVDFFRNEGCDVIILGCTHFLNLKDEIQKVAYDMKVVDSVDGVINRAISLKGVAGTFPAGEGGEQPCASQGETSPSYKISDQKSKAALYITGFCDKNDEKEYDVICKQYQIDFGGVL